MCGICGICGYVDESIIKTMTGTLGHRGPDDSGTKIFKDRGVALGHTRLSIFDLTARGHQPMCDATQLLWITYNGEIYNYRNIKNDLEKRGYRFTSNTDTEVILYSYREWGGNCLQRLNGMFAFAIWDDANKFLFLARDRIGIKPLYYFQQNDLFVFASEIKSILASGLVERNIDYDALHTPSMYQVSPLTGFKGIYKLQPGHYLTFTGKKLTIQRYWQIDPSEKCIKEDHAIDTLENLLELAVSGQMLADVPVGAFLSGGLDSSLLVALMSKNTKQRLSTFTIKYSQDDQRFEQMPDDGKYAKKVSKLFNCEHHEFQIKPDIATLLPKMVWHLDEPLADPASINTYLIAKAARDNGIIVLLNGMGGDEIFGGYRKHLACLLADLYQLYVSEFAQRWMEKIVEHLPTATEKKGMRTVRWAKRFFSFASLNQMERYFVSNLSSPKDFENLFSDKRFKNDGYWDTHCVRSQLHTLQRKDISYLTRMCLSDTQVFLPDHNLTYSDKCTMAAGVESRPPLTDHRIVEFMFSVQPHFRINGIKQKYLLKKVAARYLPHDIVNRPKAPFGSPLRSWIRGALAEMINEYLSPTSLQKRGIYNPRNVWQKIEHDRNGTEDNAHLIWTLLCNEIWLRTFFDS